MILVCQIFDRLFIRDPTKLAYEFAEPVNQNEAHLWTSFVIDSDDVTEQSLAASAIMIQD